MTTKEIYAIKPDADGWRKLPNGNNVRLGNDVTLGNGVTLGNYVRLGNDVTLWNDVTLGDDVRLGDYVTLWNDVTLGDDVRLGNYVTLGNYVRLGNNVTLGNDVKLGNNVRLGNDVTLGNCVKLGNDVVNACSIHNAYRYSCCPQITKTGEQWVQMGCYLRTRTDWDKDFWNNHGDFPNNGSAKSKARMTAYKMACLWLDAQGEGS
jgi:UDP-3-O-[3-hydroxymyristoyl] glucosamine N-acyltransferase